MAVSIQPDTAADPDALYADREDLAKARQAAEIWQARLADAPEGLRRGVEAVTGRYWLGTHGPEAGRRKELEAGIAAGQAAITLEPTRPDGHFWMAAEHGRSWPNRSA